LHRGKVWQIRLLNHLSHESQLFSVIDNY